MSCRKYYAALIDLAHGDPQPDRESRALAAHLDECPACAREFAAQQNLRAALRDLNTAIPVPPAEAIEADLLAAWPAALRPMFRAWMPLAAALAAAGIFTGWLMLHRSPAPAPAPPVAQRTAPPSAPPPFPKSAVAVVHHRRPHPARRAAPSPPRQSELAADFIAIPYTVPLAPGERADIFRVELPIAAVVSAGVPVRVADPGARAQADVLVGEDGRAHAIRLISISTTPQ